MRTLRIYSQQLYHISCVCAKSFQSCVTLCNPMDCSPVGSSVHGDSPGKNTGVGCHALDLLNSGIEPISLMFPDWQADSLLAPSGKPSIYHTVSNIVMLYITSQVLIYLITESLQLLTIFIQFSLLLPSTSTF